MENGCHSDQNRDRNKTWDHIHVRAIIISNTKQISLFPNPSQFYKMNLVVQGWCHEFFISCPSIILEKKTPSPKHSYSRGSPVRTNSKWATTRTQRRVRISKRCIDGLLSLRPASLFVALNPSGCTQGRTSTMIVHRHPRRSSWGNHVDGRRLLDQQVGCTQPTTDWIACFCTTPMKQHGFLVWMLEGILVHQKIPSSPRKDWLLGVVAVVSIAHWWFFVFVHQGFFYYSKMFHRSWHETKTSKWCIYLSYNWVLLSHHAHVLRTYT